MCPYDNTIFDLLPEYESAPNTEQNRVEKRERQKEKERKTEGESLLIHAGAMKLTCILRFV